ncbi:MAG: hypothetical protein WC408_01275 [Candidatus Micrarchaeia archaeon]
MEQGNRKEVLSVIISKNILEEELGFSRITGNARIQNNVVESPSNIISTTTREHNIKIINNIDHPFFAGIKTPEQTAEKLQEYLRQKTGCGKIEVKPEMPLFSGKPIPNRFLIRHPDRSLVYPLK